MHVCNQCWFEKSTSHACEAKKKEPPVIWRNATKGPMKGFFKVRWQCLMQWCHLQVVSIYDMLWRGVWMIFSFWQQQHIWGWSELDFIIYIYMICCNIETCAFREYKYFTVYSYTYLCFLAESGPHIYEARLPKCLRLQWTCIYIYIFFFTYIYMYIYYLYRFRERERDATSLRVFNTWETLEAFGATKCIESWVFT